MHFIYSGLAGFLLLGLLLLLSSYCCGTGLGGPSTIIDDVDLVADHDASVLIVRRSWPLLRSIQTTRLKRLLMHEFVAFGTLSTWFRCDCRRTHMLLIMQREGTLLAKGIQCGGADRLDCIVTGVSATFLKTAATDRIVVCIRLRILLHHAAERALVHRLNELRLDRHLRIRALLVNKIDTRLLACSQIIKVDVVKDFVVILLLLLLLMAFNSASSHLNSNTVTPLIVNKLPLFGHHILLLLLQMMHCLLQIWVVRVASTVGRG